MNISLEAIALPGDLVWTDRFTWSPVTQIFDYGLTGALILQEGRKQAGRPITLSGGTNWAWLPLATLEALEVLRDQEPAADMTLTLDGTPRTVRWNHDEGPISATPVFPNRSKFNNVTLRFIQVS